MFLRWSLGLCVTVLLFTNGCLRADSSANAGSSAVTNPVSQTNAAAAAETAGDMAAIEAARTNAPAVDISEAEIKQMQAEKALPSSVRTDGAAGDLFKLASSGIEEKVILAYITNSPSPFNLTADEIIYLKDLGISGDVITSTLHKDRALNVPGPAVQEARVAPSIGQDTGITTNWTGGQAQTQPDPSQVAPQAIASPADAEAVPAPAPQTEVTYSTFYSSLAPYGTWIELDGYGRVWQPTVVVANSSWSPYFDCGRWIYTDRGWYWASDYTWGWAPFHYGRWFRHYRVGWCWMPDLVWGPAWVTWRYNDAYCGWAPLPPAAYYTTGFGFTYYGASVGFSFGFGLGYSCYTYVPWHYYHHHHYNHLHAVPYHQKHEIHNNTRPVTRIVSENNKVINEGISAQRVAAATRTDVKPVAVREVRSGVPRAGRAERLDPATKTLTVYKPESRGADRTGGLPMDRVRAGYVPGKPEGDRTMRAATRTGSSLGAPTNPQKLDPGSPVVAATPAQRVVGTGKPQGGATPTASMDMPRDTRGTAKPAESRTPRETKPAGSNPVLGTAPKPEQPQTQAGHSRQPERRQAAEMPGKTSVAGQSAQARQSSVWASPRAAETPSRTERPLGPAMAAAPKPQSQPQQSVSRQPSVWASPRATEAPSRVERQAPTPPSAQASSGGQNFVQQRQQPSVWTSPRAVDNSAARVDRSSPPSVSAPVPANSGAQRQYAAPSQTPRQYTAPSYSAPQRQYTAPAAPQVPAPSQRQYSAPSAPPAPQRQYSAPPASSPPQRQYSPPPQSAPAPRQFSAPQQRSDSGRSSSAPSRGGSGRRGAES